MIRKLLVLVAALGLFAGACGGDGDAGSCAAVADDAIDLVQSMIDEFDALTVDELAEMDEEPAFFTDFEQQMEDLQSQADELGCSDSEMEALISDRIGDLTAEGMFGQMMLDEMQNEGMFD